MIVAKTLSQRLLFGSVFLAMVLGAGPDDAPPPQSTSTEPVPTEPATSESASTQSTRLVEYRKRMGNWEMDPDDPIYQGDQQLNTTQPTGASAEEVQEVREAIDEQVPDPRVQREAVAAMLAETTRRGEKEALQDYLDRLNQVARPDALPFTLQDVIELTLANNYGIQTSSYGPAINTARIVQAESVFDAIFFFNFTNNEQDTPTASQLSSTSSSVRTYTGGFRKLLPTGTQAETSYDLTRTQSNLAFQTLNPAYDSTLAFTLRQPFMRGFGLDYNRSQINLAKNDRKISFEQFRANVRDTLRAAEEAYWNLVLARRVMVVEANLLFETEKILRVYRAREKVGFDVYKAQLGQIESRKELREATFITAKNAVRAAEDGLKSIVNSPRVTLPDDIELTPVDTPFVDPLEIDRVAEILAALENRSELKIARWQVDNARIAIDVAKNQALPRLDVTFRMTVDGLGDSEHDSFHQMADNDFNTYFVGVEFEWPVGNRGPRARLRESQLVHRQAIANVKAQMEVIGNEVAQATWTLRNSYEQLAPNLKAARAAIEALEALQAREETKSPTQLDLELNLQDQVAQAQRAFIRGIVDYNRSIVALEASKGTLMQFYRINLIEDPDNQLSEDVTGP